ncbi:MAG: Pyrimidine-specific ribonucleoside hydrolase RihA [Anaerolineae bacterium]|nr:Pyrimidine-specific ribonucleoside hydrolase RihA [Anaerolineae bacterium]
MPKKPVLFVHDGGVDDYLSTILLMTMEHVRVLGIAVTPADCYIEPAVSATRKILDLMNVQGVSVAQSNVRGINPFPRIFRRDSFTIDHLPILNQRDEIRTPLASENAPEFIVKALRAETEPVTILETGPLTTVAAALDLAPDLESRIKEIIWMGGALNVKGNIDPIMEGGQDLTAEWNVYWDPFGAARVWDTKIPIIICPLDLTNNVPVTPAFLKQLGKQYQYPLSDFTGQCYALVVHQDYFFWDVLTTAYLGHPEFFTLKEYETEIITKGRSQGRTLVKPGSRKIQALDTVDLGKFYAYVLDALKR